MYSSALNGNNLGGYINNINWTSDLAIQWQNFYNTASRITFYGRSTNLNYTYLQNLPRYVDLQVENCTAYGIPYNSTNVTYQCGGNFGSRATIIPVLLFLPFFIEIIIDI